MFSYEKDKWFMKVVFRLVCFLLCSSCFAGWEYTQIELSGASANVLRKTESGWGFKASYEYNVGLQLDSCYELPSDGATLDFSGEIQNLMPNLRGKEITIVKIGCCY